MQMIVFAVLFILYLHMIERMDKIYQIKTLIARHFPMIENKHWIR